MVFSPAQREVRGCVLQLPVGSTVATAIRASAVLAGLRAEEADTLAAGIWGRKAALGQALRDQDRVELYRLLTVDPKVARRERFARQGAKSAGLFAKRREGAKAGY